MRFPATEGLDASSCRYVSRLSRGGSQQYLESIETSNGVIVNVVRRDFDLQLQGHQMAEIIIFNNLNTVRASEKCSSTFSVEVDIKPSNSATVNVAHRDLDLNF